MITGVGFPWILLAAFVGIAAMWLMTTPRNGEGTTTGDGWGDDGGDGGGGDGGGD